MSKWIQVAKKSDLTEGSTKAFTVEGQEVALSYVNGQIYAFKNECTHADMPLDEGDIVGTTLQCPYHGAKFDLTEAGKACQPPASEPLCMYKVQVDGDQISVDL